MWLAYWGTGARIGALGRELGHWGAKWFISQAWHRNNSVNRPAIGFFFRKRKPSRFLWRVLDEAPGDDLLLHGRTTLPSARVRFTSEFGMGSGGATQLYSPGRGWRVAVLGRHPALIRWTESSCGMS